MRQRFHAAARAELDSAIIYYENLRKGLGLSLLADVEVVLLRMRENPNQFARVHPLARRGKTNRFPYGLVYIVRQDEIFIVAVMHLSREPDYWKSRLDEQQPDH
jgi:hypothetical protein